MASPDTSSKTALTGLTLPALKAELQEMDKQHYRAQQVFAWIHQHKVGSIEEMSNISKKLRGFLAERFYIPRPKLVSDQLSVEDGSRKFLFELEDGQTVETVLIPKKERLTQCVSSQVGCAMACTFCTTGDMGFFRNLATHEIVDQVLEVARMANSGDYERLTNVVYMGMGEPFQNLDPVIDSANILMEDWGMGISQRKITVSTSGLADKMEEFGKRCTANIALSLNATTNEFRSQIMPVNKRWPLEKLMQVCRDYPLKARRRITFEYVLLGGLNDSLEDAQRLRLLLAGIPAKINLIPFNPSQGNNFERPSQRTVHAFQHYLLDHGMNATVRISAGQDITAACGQLRSIEERRKRNPTASNALTAQ